MNKRKLAVICIMVYWLLNAPIFHFVTSFGGISYYSLLDNIQMDISERQFTVVYSVIDLFKE